MGSNLPISSPRIVSTPLISTNQCVRALSANVATQMATCRLHSTTTFGSDDRRRRCQTRRPPTSSSRIEAAVLIDGCHPRIARRIGTLRRRRRARRVARANARCASIDCTTRRPRNAFSLASGVCRSLTSSCDDYKSTIAPNAPIIFHVSTSGRQLNMRMFGRFFSYTWKLVYVHLYF